MKDIGVKMSKRKSANSVLSFDGVLNDTNDWLAEENGEDNEIGGIIFMNYAVKEKKLILTQVRSA